VVSVHECLEALRSARELVSNPRRWCRLALARDGLQMPVEVHNMAAQSWCMVGALLHATMPDTALAARCYSFLECANPFGLDLADVNDAECLGHDAVLRIYDDAIASVCQEAKGDERDGARGARGSDASGVEATAERGLTDAA
jgi:hypothetical protein